MRQRILEHGKLELLVRTAPDDMPDGAENALIRYLVVRSAGLVEAIRDDVADLHAQRIGHPRLHRRIAHGLRTGQGVTPKQIQDFVASFDVSWGGDLTAFLNEEDGDRGNNLGAMVAARKRIAHGDGDQVTRRKALQWSSTATEISEWLVRRFNPNGP